MLYSTVNRTKVLTIILFCVAGVSVRSEESNAEKILQSIRTTLSSIKDFQVDLSIKIDLEYLKIPDAKAKYFFKSPDKSRLVSDGFGLLPKQGIGLPTSQLLNSPHTSVITGKEIFNGKTLTKVKVIPLDESSEIILSTLWIDEKTSLIYKVSSTTRKGTLDMAFTYGEPERKFGLPKTVTIVFVLPQFSLPKSLTGDLQKNNREQKNAKKEVKGKAIVTYSNYIINKGLSDDLFKDKESKNE